MSNANEPAYPIPATYETGLTKREAMAMHMMRKQVLFPASIWQFVRWMFGFSYTTGNWACSQNAKRAAEMADALLADLAK